MDKFTKIWIILILLTLFSFSLGWFKLLTVGSFFVLLLTVFIKGQLISDHFMGLKETKKAYRFIPSIWLLVTLLLVAIAYYTPIK